MVCTPIPQSQIRASRVAPPFNAEDCPNDVKLGLDGNVYISKQSWKWVKMSDTAARSFAANMGKRNWMRKTKRRAMTFSPPPPPPIWTRLTR